MTEPPRSPRSLTIRWHPSGIFTVSVDGTLSFQEIVYAVQNIVVSIMTDTFRPFSDQTAENTEKTDKMDEIRKARRKQLLQQETYKKAIEGS